jgi:nitrite reductase/ring-hydroxylating ferredoxin subunit
MVSRRHILRTLFTGLAAVITKPFRALDAQISDNPDTVSVQPDSLVSPADSSTIEPDSLTTAPEPLAVIPLDDAPDLSSIGGSARIEINGSGILLIRDDENSIRAVSSSCTHKRVKLKYDKKRDQIRCPAHGSRFELSGEVIKGPAKEALTRYDARLEVDRILIYAPAIE